MSQQAYGGAGGTQQAAATTERSSWAVGWTLFAAIMMAIQGTWWLIAGIVALANEEFFVVTEEYVFQFSATTWGWVHLVVGVVLFVAGLALVTGALWARVVGVIVASVAMLAAFAWMPWYPIWALLFIVASISVIWALTTHSEDLNQT